MGFVVILADTAGKTGEVVGAHASRRVADGHAGALEGRPHYRPRVISWRELETMQKRGWVFTV